MFTGNKFLRICAKLKSREKINQRHYLEPRKYTCGTMK